MRIDLHSLGTDNCLEREGAKRAASSLTQLSGAETYVCVTPISLIPVEDFREELRDGELVGVRVGFEGRRSGRTS